jgi:hypothetical protein
MKDQFNYLYLYKNEEEKYIYICLKFELASEDDIEFINCHELVEATIDFTKERDIYSIKGKFENTHIVREILNEITEMRDDRKHNDSTVTDRVGYFGVLVSALHQFAY